VANDDKVFLYDNSTFCLEKVGKSLGIDTIMKSIGSDLEPDMIVYGSVIKGRAEIEGGAAQPEEVILFEGGLQVYEKESGQGAEKRGYRIICDGKIRTAQPANELLEDEEGLDYVVFGGLTSEEELVERVKAIVRGYDHQKEEELRRKREIAERGYKRGHGAAVRGISLEQGLEGKGIF